ncbi:MAG: hypothetical protein RIQ83_2482 [Pseudomonadota bacterium]
MKVRRSTNAAVACRSGIYCGQGGIEALADDNMLDWDGQVGRQCQLAIEMEGAKDASVAMTGLVCFQRVLCQRRLQPQPAQQQQPDFQLETTHRPL